MHRVNFFFDDDRLVMEGCMNNKVLWEPDLHIYTSTGLSWFAYEDKGWPENPTSWCRGKYGFGGAYILDRPRQGEFIKHYLAKDLNTYSDLIQYGHEDLDWVAVGNKLFINYNNGTWIG